MLSRSAERLYWMARYLERTENTARLISATMHLIYDLPYGVELGWRNLLNICGVEEAFYQRFKNPSEQNTTRFLLADMSNPGSLLASLSFARENIRTSRELMPDEAWQQVNEMYLYANNNLDSLSNRRGRALFLQEIMAGCQRFTGFMAGSMSSSDSARFICIGRNLERADMTSRIMDFGTVLLAENRSTKMREYETILWINVLKSLSAVLMYRKHVRNRIKGEDVLNYLLKNPDFPRAVLHCIEEITHCIKRLPHAVELFPQLEQLEQQVLAIEIKQTTPEQLHQVLDGLQAKFDDLHQQIAAMWFLNSLGEAEAEKN
ncbi:alpha-E domain-containing protein [Methylomonas sp. LW13]|uniref:alpha-E domain-containing protein n=1 Tax=unclassified Methylomonas TaxID=2608980 RepID=UPI00051C5E23|nr:MULTISPECIES: alpha-E domain-containing protein [unclassified Methylomonas]PKD41322.1 alpha-E domain-containing protein [Methylomonas sp. Kb3]QBC26165.1 alpha-E domain-containing protein [Methylomonas sp. LW13]